MTDITQKEREAHAATPVSVRLLVLALVIALGAWLFGPLIGIGGDAWEAYRAPSRDPFGNHSGVVPYGAPQAARHQPDGSRQECSFDGRRLTCGAWQEGQR